MDKEQLLLRIAEAQQGYFTSRQAEECGFLRSNFHRKIQARKWVKEQLRGIYRLANYPLTPRPELALWTLWSADKHGNPQGIWSHETALEIHGLSDVSPLKLHLSVPHGFRKRRDIPRALCLHFVDEIPPSDVESQHGFRVTTPLRTLADLVRERSTQYEHIERAILDLAIQKSLMKGLATIREMEQLQKLEGISKGMQNILVQAIDKVWTQASGQLEEWGRLAEPYTIGLSLERQGFGTAVLCQYRSHYFLVTAGHVARALRKASSVSMLLRFDHIRKEYPSHPPQAFKVLEWDSSLEESSLNNVLENQPKDLAILIPTEAIIGALKAYKAFYPIVEEPSAIGLKDTLLSLGGIEPIYSDQGDVELQVGPYGFVAAEYRLSPDVDYLVCPVHNHVYEIRNSRSKAISSFEGLSGSGLWKITDHSPSLVGIAIAQDPVGYDHTGVRNIYFHGPHSILSMLHNLRKLPCPLA